MTDLWKVERRLTSPPDSTPQHDNRRVLEIGGVTVVPVFCSIVVWVLAACSFFPSQQARLIGIAGRTVAPIVLSLNASFMFVGFSAGAALGSLTVPRSLVVYLGLVGATCAVVAWLLLCATSRRTAAVSVRA